MREAMLVFAVLAALMAGVLESAPTSAGAATSAPAHAITWLAAGDSYASGQGLENTTKPCADGTGQDGLSTTWAVAAAQVLRSEGVDLASSSPDLVACTGAISADLLADNSAKLGNKHHAQWTPKMGRFDLVTFSFGGDDIGFAGIVEHCEEFGCPSDADVRAKITALATTGLDVKGVQTQPYPTFLDNVAKDVVTAGGNVVVMGYPEVVEGVDDWSPGRTTCAGMSAGEDQRMRGWAGNLNATIGASVAKVNALPATQRNDVLLTFIDSVTGQSADGIPDNDPNLFEPTSGNHHELCSQGGSIWLNGLIKSDYTRSFHPDQSGETAMGNLAAEVISELTWPWSPWDTPPSAAGGPASLVPWGQSGVSAPFAGCELYLPTVSGIALQGTPTYDVSTSAGIEQEPTLSSAGTGVSIFYSIDFNDAMGEIVIPPGAQSPWTPPDGFNPTTTTYSDGSTSEYWATDSDFDLITIPGQPCKYELMTVTDYPPPQATFFVLVASLRPIKGTRWG